MGLVQSTQCWCDSTCLSSADQRSESGGTGSGVTINGGFDVVFGSAKGEIINSSGFGYVESGGVASGATVNSGGFGM